MRQLVLATPLLSLWTVMALAAPQLQTDPGATAYFIQESKLASQRNVAAEECLSWMYAEGFGTARDMDKMVYWASAAANAGSDAGELDLAKAYAWGVGVKADPKKALAMVQKLVAKGYPPAETTLGILYVTGTGVAENKAESVRWLTKAAEAGDFEGQIRLGSFYHWGDDVKADPAESQKWLDKAALHKSACAVEYFFQMPFLINAYLDPKAFTAKDVHGKMGISFANKNGKADNIIVFQPSGSHKVDDAWVEAARKAKLPPWPDGLPADEVSGFWIEGTYEGYDPAFTAALRAAIDAAKQFPKDVLLKGSKGDGQATVSFTYTDGVVSDERITKSSGEPSEDAAALAAVVDAKYPSTPYQYAHIKMSFAITVNFATYAPAKAATVTIPVTATGTPPSS